jgi:hypothetical protein
MTKGESLVDINNNPTNNTYVASIKGSCANVIDLITTVNPGIEIPERGTDEQRLLYHAAVAAIVQAQMMAVKYVTYTP